MSKDEESLKTPTSWIIDRNSKSKSFRPEISTAIPLDVKLLRKLQVHHSSNEEIRYCLHSDSSNLTHIMLIRKFKNIKGKVKRHPKYGKYIHVLKGRARVNIFDESGQICQSYLLDKKCFAVYLPTGTWHTCDAESRNTVILESVAGPFIADESNEYFDYNSDGS